MKKISVPNILFPLWIKAYVIDGRLLLCFSKQESNENVLFRREVYFSLDSKSFMWNTYADVKRR